MGVTNLDQVQAGQIEPIQKIAVDGAVKGALDPTGAATLTGLVVITKGSICTMTLATPKAGDPISAGGDDGKVLTILTTTAYAHVITTAANKINGNKGTLTFAAAVGNNIVLQAYGGVWYSAGTEKGVTLS